MATKKNKTYFNSLGHRAYLRTDDDDPERNADGLRLVAPGASFDVEPGSVLAHHADKSNGIVTESEYKKLQKEGRLGEASLGYEINPSDRPAIVDSVPEAVAVGNPSLAPAGGTEDGAPPRGDAPGFGFEGAIGIGNVGDPGVPVPGLPPHTAATGASPADQKPATATDPATTTAGAEAEEDLVAEEPRSAEGKAKVEEVHGKTSSDKAGGKK